MTLKLNHVASLKEKRNIIKSILDKVSHRHNISCAEIQYHDALSYTTLAFVGVGNRRKILTIRMQNIINLIETNYQLEIIESEITELI